MLLTFQIQFPTSLLYHRKSFAFSGVKSSIAKYSMRTYQIRLVKINLAWWHIRFWECKGADLYKEICHYPNKRNKLTNCLIRFETFKVLKQKCLHFIIYGKVQGFYGNRKMRLQGCKRNTALQSLMRLFNNIESGMRVGKAEHIIKLS